MFYFKPSAQSHRAISPPAYLLYKTHAYNCYTSSSVPVLVPLVQCTMPTTCGFPNCKFRARYRGSDDTRHFYRVPKKPVVLRERWLIAIGRTEETIVNQVKAAAAFVAAAAPMPLLLLPFTTAVLTLYCCLDHCF